MRLSVGIIGGGVGGTTLAHALGCLCPRASVTVYEAFSTPQARGGTLTLQTAGILLNRIGLGTQLQQILSPFEEFTFIGERGPLASPNVRDLAPPHAFVDGRPVFGMVMRRELQNVLHKNLPDSATMVYSKALQSIHPSTDTVRCEFKDGTTAEHDLVIGADGIHSIVRGTVFEAPPPEFLGVHYAMAVRRRSGPDVVTKEGLPPPTRPKIWLVPGSEVLTWGPIGSGGEAGQYDLAGVAFKATEMTPDEWQSTCTREELMNLYRQTGVNDPIVANIMEEAQDLYLWGIHSHQPLEGWTDPTGRVVLLGDAAHASPPSLGQGANQAIQDAYCLARLLGEEEEGGDWIGVKSKLAAYEAIRRPATTDILKASRAMGDTRLASGWRAVARNLGIRILQFPPLGRRVLGQNFALAV